LKSKSSEVEQCRKQKGKLEADLKRRITEKSDAQEVLDIKNNTLKEFEA
jgi:hypothetical protein